MSDICLNPKESVGCLGMCRPMFSVGYLGTMFSITYLPELDNSISSSASRMLMCDAYPGPMTTERGMSYEPSDILSWYLYTFLVSM